MTDSTRTPDAAATPAPPEVLAQARALVAEFPECFWFWRMDAGIHTFHDVRLVVEHLRRYGDRRAWAAAQELNQCLSPRFRSTS